MRSSALLIGLFVLCSCALRPLYKELATDTTDPVTTLQVIDASTSAPLAGIKVEMSEGKNRFTATTAADGTFSLPNDKKYFAENPYLVVTGTMPNGYKLVHTDKVLAPAAPKPAPVVVPVAAPVEAAPVTPQNNSEMADAGTGGNIEPAAPVKAP